MRQKINRKPPIWRCQKTSGKNHEIMRLHHTQITISDAEIKPITKVGKNVKETETTIILIILKKNFRPICLEYFEF